MILKISIPSKVTIFIHFILLSLLLTLSAASCTFQPDTNILATLEKQITVEWIYTPSLTPTLTPTPTPTLTPTPMPTPLGGSGRLAFSKPSSAYGNIFLVNFDGSGLTQLTNTSYDWAPAWSVDGKRIVFISERDLHDHPVPIKDRDSRTNNGIYIMNADGSNQTLISKTPAYYASPSWSPDSKQIVYAAFLYGNFEIFVMNADGTEVKQLAVGQNPTWSPDGSRIVYNATPMGHTGSQIFVMNADGSGQTQLTDNPGWNETPAWSPDAKRIAFSYINKKNIHAPEVWDIFIINSDGSGQTQVTHTSNTNPRQGCGNPTWSPDGSFIASICGDMLSGLGTIHIIRITGPGWEEMDSEISVYKGNGAVWQP